MKSRPVILREVARRDVDEAISYYLSENPEKAALGFIDALQQACARISRYPAIGITRYAHELGLPGLRCCLMKRYPYLLFYVERDECMDVWRVLHSQRDIPAWMQADDR